MTTFHWKLTRLREVEEARCTCVASRDRPCKHMAALICAVNVGWSNGPRALCRFPEGQKMQDILTREPLSGKGFRNSGSFSTNLRISYVLAYLAESLWIIEC